MILDPKKNDYTILLDDRLNCSLLILRVDIPWPRAQLRRSGTIKREFEISAIKSIIHRNFLCIYKIIRTDDYLAHRLQWQRALQALCTWNEHF